MALNIQETKELEYFQKMQVMKQEVKALRVELGMANAEINHLTHLLKEKVTSEMMLQYAVTKRSCASKYARTMAELIVAKEQLEWKDFQIKELRERHNDHCPF